VLHRAQVFSTADTTGPGIGLRAGWVHIELVRALQRSPQVHESEPENSAEGAKGAQCVPCEGGRAGKVPLTRDLASVVVADEVDDRCTVERPFQVTTLAPNVSKENEIYTGLGQLH
jgi:hypothetical protein